jgi:hypothetical protein
VLARGLQAQTPATPSPNASSLQMHVVLLLFSHFLYFWAFCFLYLSCVFCNCYATDVWVLWTLYIPLTTFTSGLGSWHPCQESIGPHLNLMHCLRVLAFLVFIFGLFSPNFMEFYFHISIFKKEKEKRRSVR